MFSVLVAGCAACDDDSGGGSSALRGDFEVVSFETRTGCDDSAPWSTQPLEAPYFRLDDIEVVHTPLLGYFPCSTAEAGSCDASARVALSFGRHRDAWYALDGDLRSGEDGCAMEMRAGPLEVTADGGLSLVVRHYQGVLPLSHDDCNVDVLEARYDELPCLDQTRRIARRLR